MESTPLGTDVVARDIDSDEDELPLAYFELTPGFLAFVGVMLLPAIAALVIFIGAALVAGDVRTADAQDASASVSSSASLNADESRFNVSTPPNRGVTGWKRALVGICPAH